MRRREMARAESGDGNDGFANGTTHFENWKTSNTEHPTPNIEWLAHLWLTIGCWVLVVGCSMFICFYTSNRFQPFAPKA
jgi:hypothetical protein